MRLFVGWHEWKCVLLLCPDWNSAWLARVEVLLGCVVRCEGGEVPREWCGKRGVEVHLLMALFITAV
jgi:hypothetical protein